MGTETAASSLPPSSSAMHGSGGAAHDYSGAKSGIIVTGNVTNGSDAAATTIVSTNSSTSMREYTIKYGALALLVLQNTFLVVLMRYSRTVQGPRYASATAVFSMEVLI